MFVTLLDAAMLNDFETVTEIMNERYNRTISIDDVKIAIFVCENRKQLDMVRFLQTWNDQQ